MFCYIQLYELRYDAQYPDPPKVSLDAAIERWKLTAEAKDTKIDLEQYDAIREEWWSKDKVSKMLGMFLSKRMYQDWKVAEPDDHKRKKAGWADFVSKMQIYYKPTENLILKKLSVSSIVASRQ